jgi:integrase
MGRRKVDSHTMDAEGPVAQPARFPSSSPIPSAPNLPHRDERRADEPVILSAQSEDIVPTSARWWAEQAEEYVEWLRKESELSQGYLTRNRRYLVAFQGDCERAGTAPPAGPTEVTREHIRAVKGSGLWGPRTLKTTFSVVRGFLRWAGNPLSDAKNPVWQLPSGFADRRNWIDRNEMVALYRLAEGRSRVRVVLQGFNGLRECEVRRLRVRDLSMALPRPTLTVRGKGRYGGKFRTIPMDPMTRAVLEKWVSGKAADELLYPVGHTVADGELATLGQKAGVSVRVTGHVLRRSFGRLAYQAGVPVPTIQRIFGHASIDQTLHYIGVGQEEMTEGFAVFDTHIRAAMDPPFSDPQRQTAF